uniref:Matrix remodeling associated 5 n=1 Tax=Cyclopterus lumpus TaxID=8103 RepID=A0A8C2XVF0_CYCLU
MRWILSVILASQECLPRSTGSKSTFIHWMLPNGSRVEAPYSSPDNRVSLSSDGQLVIKAVSHADTGIYYCIAKVHEDLAVMPFHLTVHESSSPPPGEDTSITPIEGFAGNPISLPCTASGSPDAEINWILPNSNIVSFKANSSRALVYSNGTLHIPQTQTDSGQLACIARNEGGEVKLVVNLDVKEAVENPQIRGSKPDSLSLTVGNTMILNCSFEGSKLPQLTWILPNGTPLHSGVRFLKFFHKPDGSLIISNPSMNNRS